MEHNENVGSQLESYLPGMSDSELGITTYPAGYKPPHQMTPEEFASHPYAVFHSTHLTTDEPSNFDGWDLAKRGGMMHVGTEQSALERHLMTSKLAANRAHYRKNATMFVAWHSPTDTHGIKSDAEAQYVSNASYYKNAGEDSGSLSLVTPDPNNDLTTHSTFVRKAIAKGLGHEIPHRTRVLYDARQLDSYPLEAWHTKQLVERHPAYNDTTLESNPTKEQIEAQSRLTVQPPRVSNLGPRLQDIVQQSRRDGKNWMPYNVR